LPLSSDPPVKQIILALDEKEKCIIEDLDETHVLIRSDRLDWLKAELEKEVS
jgi:TFIIH basal transcription factor complex TTD-A subunit